MIIGDFHVVGAVIPPFKANPVLIVYVIAVLPLTMPGKFFQPQAGNREIPQVPRGLQKNELHPRCSLNRLKFLTGKIS
jgi:hypothetical protein